MTSDLYLKALSVLLLSVAFVSCSRPEQTSESESEIARILSSISRTRKIFSIDEYYGGSATKAVGQTPNAYVVNYEDNEGYVVIGINGTRTAVIAIGDSGAIDPDTLEPLGDGSDTTGTGPSTVGGMIRDGVDNFGMIDEDHGEDGNGPPGEQTPIGTIGNNGSSGPEFTPEFVNVTSQLLNTKWDQGYYGATNGVYNKYCTDPNRVASVLSGCAVAAFAQVVAYNRFPNLTVNGSILDYSLMTDRQDATHLSEPGKEYVSLLYGVIFHNTPHLLLFEEGTAIMSADLMETMEDFGYTNVAALTSTGGGFNHRMQEITLAQLHGGRPVIMESYGWNENVFPYIGGHYWVIDGCKDISCTRVFHFNFGWGGDCDGWFNPICLNPTEAVTYDNPSNTHNASDHYDTNYDFPFTRIITYTLPSSVPHRSYSL